MISDVFIRRPKLAMVISLVMMVAGIISIPKLPVAEYPEISPPEVRVSTAYSGASAEVITETIAAPLEAEFNGLEQFALRHAQANRQEYMCAKQQHNHGPPPQERTHMLEKYIYRFHSQFV